MVRVRFRGRFSCQLIIDSRMPVHDPPGLGSGYRFTIHDLILLSIASTIGLGPIAYSLKSSFMHAVRNLFIVIIV